jgi:SAM-dependent methyltransferase
MQNKERFSGRAENYSRDRPHYPAEIIPFLQKELGLNSHWKVADIGSGTGISSELFLNNGNVVYAIEPNKEMRKQAENKFTDNKNFISINAEAEATPLAANSIDLIVAGQAFHWFDPDKAKREFQRLAHPGTYLLLMRNARIQESPFQKAYEKMCHEFIPDYEAVRKRNIDEKTITEFFSPHQYYLKSFPNAQHLDLNSLRGLLLSSSFAPQENQDHYKPMMDRLNQIFDQFNENGKITFEYNCKLYYGLFA